METNIKFNSKGTELSGTLYKALRQENAGLLILPGGGNIPHKQTHYPALQREYAKQGITTFSFDYRGVEVNGVKLAETNINTRIEDSLTAFDLLQSNIKSNNMYVYGQSMGGPVAIEIVNQKKAAGLILVVPAAYSLEARDKNFGPDFSAAIRKPDNWKDSPDFKNLRGYKGKVFLVYAAKDEVIPIDVSNSYIDIVRGRGKILSFENSKHRFLNEPNGVQLRATLREQLLNFINS